MLGYSLSDVTIVALMGSLDRFKHVFNTAQCVHFSNVTTARRMAIRKVDHRHDAPFLHLGSHT